MARPYLVVRASVEPSVMEEFERWYCREHLPHVMAIPGVVKAYRAKCNRRGVNWTALYEMSDDASVQKAITSPQADRARRDWEKWAQHVSEVTVEIYAPLGPLSVFHHLN
ncbi:MAG: hypothetical protein J4O00_10910 [Chloroflexi bacterium]|nr:hypothetical protein [Chloroflexota bacterium]MCI0814727.1 hypothetical protein [Chloroflexota bacterium]MCI0820504.1 hypothetical protein [Chloroflexota bacterium]MCI0840118.1 hypothetical protein [Chloroflexota bacterium]